MIRIIRDGKGMWGKWKDLRTGDGFYINNNVFAYYSRPRSTRRKTVRCWYCGHKARRTPGYGVAPVIGRKRRVRLYGICGTRGCTESMLLPCDAKYALRAAIEYDLSGGNRRSEYD